MRRSAISSAAREEESEINLTPMLDVVFIMLIFFIVTANFIKDPGLEINRPDSETAQQQNRVGRSGHFPRVERYDLVLPDLL